jgi:hypothetical protein
MSTALLQTTFFGPIQWYQKLYRYEQTLIEQYDSYQKQTYRNRCVIATANGLQVLTVPVEHNADSQELIANSPKVKDLRISDHNQWRRIHWTALQSAYSESPFFDYYADDIRPFFEKKYEYLVDFNEAIRQTVCDLLDIHPNVSYTSGFRYQLSGTDDFREVIHAKHPQHDADFQPRRYWQVFERKYGFQANLSILDLLFNMGNEAIFYL